MTIELAGAILFFVLAVFALLFTLTKSSHIDSDSFPNRGRFYAGLIIWVLAAIVAVFMSFPGYSEWFVPLIYPILKGVFLTLFIVGLFMVLTTVIAFPQHMNYFRREIDGRSDRLALLDNIRQIASQPYPITELFTLVLKELSSFMVLQKGAIFMINPSRREMYLAAQIGLDKDELSRLERFSIGRDIISQAAAEQTPFVSGDLAQSDSASRKLLLAGRELTMSAATLPLSSRDKSLGVLLVLCDKPYRFEKADRMLLMAAAEAVAGVVESNRLARDNQKLAAQLEDTTKRSDVFREGVGELAQAVDYRKLLLSGCRKLVARFGVLACRVVKIENGELIDIARHETEPNTAPGSQSYRIAVIDAIRRKKMVVLNQEAKGQSGETYISRSSLLCPFSLGVPGEYALLMEAPGNGLPLDNRSLLEIETAVNLIIVALNMAGLKEAETLNHTAVNALLRILKIKPEAPRREVFRAFLDETGHLLAAETSALVFIRDDQNSYRLLDDGPAVAENLAETIFLPGEGPVGKAGATGETLEFTGRDKVVEGWSGLDQVNQDFLNYVGGERGVPYYQLCIPVTVLNEVVAVLAVFGHTAVARPAGREKAMVLLAAQLLSIRISMAVMDERQLAKSGGITIPEAGQTINRINNDLATIMGQAELLERQSGISGPTRLAAGEILKAAEQAAAVVKHLQEKVVATDSGPTSAGDDIATRLDHFLKSHHVTGNLYMFEDNRTVVLHQDLADSKISILRDERLSSILNMVLKFFVTLQEEGDEVLLQSRLTDTYFYLSLVRGSREKHRGFDPSAHDYGSPDVLPDDIADSGMIQILGDNRGEVSFDRFGRRPTYLSFRFPRVDNAVAGIEKKSESPVTGLRILAIDDQQMILDLLSGICQSLGLELTAFRDPARGLEVFRSRPFDIVMVDLAIGRVSGWDIAREIKRHAPDTPVIMMTGWGINIEPDRAARGGVDYTLAKPFRIEQLTEVIALAKTKLISS